MQDQKAWHALSALDGRYSQNTQELRSYFSEASLIKYRIIIEISYLLFLNQKLKLTKLNSSQKKQFQTIYQNLNDADLQNIKQLERKTGHDVKAVEYFIRQKCKEWDLPLAEYVHFALTSEDINNLAYSLAIRDSLPILITQLKNIILKLADLAEQNAKIPMLARTHGQPAVPTTFGKEMLLFAIRLDKELLTLQDLPVEAKFNGAVGNFNAHVAAYPQVDWLKFSQDFIKTFHLEPTLFSNQILAADSYLKIFQSLQLINSILIGFNQDMWRYISDGFILQKKAKGQVGSSTMPQKINPIDFENSEGNLGLANALLTFFIQKLPISRLQRDLSDSTVKRNIGSSFAYCLLGYKSCLRALDKIKVDQKALLADLDQHWEIISEGIQTILRTGGDNQAYEKLKTFTQGKKITAQNMTAFIKSLTCSDEIKQRLSKLTPQNYFGLSEKIVQIGIKQIKNKWV